MKGQGRRGRGMERGRKSKRSEEAEGGEGGMERGWRAGFEYLSSRAPEFLVTPLCVFQTTTEDYSPQALALERIESL